MAVAKKILSEPVSRPAEIIRFGSEICGDFQSATEKEWLETNGLGGYASSTIIGTNTRKYHGLLVATTKPPLGRMVMLSKLEETLVLRDGSRYNLSCNKYPAVIHPEGYRYMEEFRLDPFPIFTYRIGDIVVEKAVFMVHGENSTVITYKVLISSGYFELVVRPLVAARDYHWISIENMNFNKTVEHFEGYLKMKPYSESPILYLANNADRFEPTGYWYKTFEYQKEKERGLEYNEDLYSPGEFGFLVKEGDKVYMVASTEGRKMRSVEVLESSEVLRRNEIAEAVNLSDPLAIQLAISADSFLVKRMDGLTTVLAGYHWFWDWGRDALISLPGAALTLGRFKEARDILLTFAKHCDQGMIPNRFPEESKDPDYNTVDASLWFFWAVHKFLEYTNDYAFVEANILDCMEEIIQYYINGTRFGIKMDKDGLISTADSDLQLTWMDAKVGGWVVTPRNGKAVEVNALWYNALKIMESICDGLNLKYKNECARLAFLAKKNYDLIFWNEASGCLYDCVNEEGPDKSIRPNQIFALSLPFRLLPKEKEKKVLDVVGKELLTPYGLRTLSPGDSNYRGIYIGDQRTRDASYHQGTVWPWLLSHFITAYLNVYGRTKNTKEEAKRFLIPITDHLKEAGIATISEIFDGDPPYHPRGAISQAFSVAEILRIYKEELQ
ncbi:MAG: amylo-alpha-1,6-glucosidase [Candidatus Omnitrophota bacterium]